MSKGFDVVNLHGIASGVIATPYIGENENWWIGNEDTRINARGEKGDQGEPGPAGPQGIPGETGANGQDVDLSRIESLETEVTKLSNDLTHAVMPDYTKSIDISTYKSSNNQFTTPSDGWIIGNGSTGALNQEGDQGRIEIYADGKMVHYVGTGVFGRYQTFGYTLPICKNSSIYLNANSPGAIIHFSNFVPCIGSSE